ncbi:MAG: hypothetical protein V4506_14480 [Bacteroidota bacterium]
METVVGYIGLVNDTSGEVKRIEDEQAAAAVIKNPSPAKPVAGV